MRSTWIAASLASLSLLAACSERAANEEAAEVSHTTNIDIPGQRPEQRNAAGASNDSAAPGIDVTSAPGVAFNYSYAFVLPDEAISAVQEQHASACEKLGPARCRITGMRYTLVEEDEVRGELRFKLDPALARQFGKEGIAAVVKAEGKLVDAAIEGRDVGSEITRSQRRSDDNAGEIARIEARLAAGGLSEGERATLRGQADRLRAQQTQERQSRAEGEEMLADTPMTFSYSGDTGFTLGHNAVGDAWESARGSFTTMVSFILLLVGTLLPWAVLAGLIVLLWRKTPLRTLRHKPKDRAAAE